MRNLKILLSIAIFSLIIGCGFQMRGAYDIPNAFKVIQIMPFQPYDPLQRALRQSLKSNQVTVVEPSLAKETGAGTLTLQSQTLNDRVVAYGADGQVNRSTLQFKILYQLSDANGKVVVSNGVVIVERDLTVNPNAVLATDGERAYITTQLIRDAADRLLWQLSTIPEKHSP